MRSLFIENTQAKWVIDAVTMPFFNAKFKASSYEDLKNVCLGHEYLPEDFATHLVGLLNEKRQQDKQTVKNDLTQEAFETQISEDMSAESHDQLSETRDKKQEETLQQEKNTLTITLQGVKQRLQQANYRMDTLIDSQQTASYMHPHHHHGHNPYTDMASQSWWQLNREINELQREVKTHESREKAIQKTLKDIEANHTQRLKNKEERLHRKIARDNNPNDMDQLSYKARIKLDRDFTKQEIGIDDEYQKLEKNIRTQFWGVFFDRMLDALQHKQLKGGEKRALHEIITIMRQFHDNQAQIDGLELASSAKKRNLSDQEKELGQLQNNELSLTNESKALLESLSKLTAKQEKLNRWNKPSFALAVSTTLATGLLTWASSYPTWVTAMGGASILCTPPVLWGLVACMTVSSVATLVLSTLRALNNRQKKCAALREGEINSKLPAYAAEIETIKVNIQTLTTDIDNQEKEVAVYKEQSSALLSQAGAIQPVMSYVDGFASDSDSEPDMEDNSSPRSSSYNPSMFFQAKVEPQPSAPPPLSLRPQGK